MQRLEALSLAFDYSPVGICVTQQGLITLCNREVEWMLGCDSEDLVGANLAAHFCDHDEYVQFSRLVKAGMMDTGVFSDERVLRRQDGSLFWCQMVGRALDRSDAFACTIWSLQDLSAKRAITRSLTSRERHIVRLLVAGYKTKQMANALGVSPRTVDGYRAGLMKKLGAKSQAQMMALLLAPRSGTLVQSRAPSTSVISLQIGSAPAVLGD